jgi:hypothetical protein
MSWLLAVAKLRVPRVTKGITEAVGPEHAKEAGGRLHEDRLAGRLPKAKSSGMIAA